MLRKAGPFSVKPLFKIAINAFSLLTIGFGCFAQSPIKAVDLRCEYLVNPLGIDAAHPRLSWHLQDARKGAKQTAYQVFIGKDSVFVSQGRGRDWQSDTIHSGSQIILYHGRPLQPFTKYYWTVQVWDQEGRATVVNEVASFETGMMENANWKGAWISDDRDTREKAAPWFRKSFVSGKKIRSARAYVAAAGLFELYINGKKIGDHWLDPAYTRFDRRLLYVTHDVTTALQSGNNTIGVLLGNGWYNLQSTAVWNFHEAPWRERPAFCLDLRITYEDGSVATITSGKDWKTSLSPVIFNSIYTGEHYDARLEQPGWNTPAFNDSGWKEVIYRSAPTNQIVAAALYPIRLVDTLPARSLRKFSDTVYVFDLGRNIAGISEIQLKGEPGTIVRLRHAERLYPNGRVDQSNIDVHYRPKDNTDPFQTDIFILKGSGEESFRPRFNYKGFQYVEVTSSKPVQLKKESLRGYFMHSDVPPAGTIASSNPVIDKIWQAANNSYLSNLFGYPTDCPQREKNGWTGDAHIAVETGLYNFDGITIYEKWMADHRDEQQANGVLPSIIPTGGWGYEWGNGPDWTSTIAIIPWEIYLFYGDTTLLSRNYENIKRYVDHIQDISNGSLTTWGLGDWVPVSTKPPVEFTSSIYYFVDAGILAQAAKILGKTSDYEKYAALAQQIKNAFNRKYLDEGKGIYGQGIQTELSMPLYWGLVPDGLKARVADRLAARVHADGDHINVGLLGTKAILNALSENGYADLAYKLASQETYPSWGWWMVNGATTLYENWQIDAASDMSLNHIMFGEIGAWMYKGLAGIRPDPLQPGFKNILLQPHFVSGLDHFEATYRSPYGKILSSWKRKGKKISYTVVVPPNSQASLWLSLGAKQQVYRDGVRVDQTDMPLNITAGQYVFEIN
ncbi:MAG: glycoside hydrolase family 78 protein [Flavisolibacter sp.]